MKIFHLISILFFCCVGFVTKAQTPDWEWAKSAEGWEGYYLNIGYGICTNTSGNVYVTGIFQSPTLIVGNDTLINTTKMDDNLFGNRDDNFFIAKYDSSGNVIWAKDANGNSGSGGYSINTDAYGNVYVMGYFDSLSIIFGNDTLTNSGLWNNFIAKYDALGNVVWAKNIEGSSLSLDAKGNIYTTGAYRGTIVLGNDTITGEGVFVVKYDSSGNVIWSRSAGGNSINYYGLKTSISTDAGGNVLIAGNFSAPYLIFSNDTLINNGMGNVFIVKYSSQGNVIWAKSAASAQGIYNDYSANSITTDANSNAYITGGFTYYNIIFGNDTLVNDGYSQVYIVKYDSSGNVIWANSSTGHNANAGGFSISTDANNNVYAAGVFGGSSAIFGNDTLYSVYNSPDLDSPYNSIFIVKYDATGNVIWDKSAGGISADLNVSIDAKDKGNIYITGDFDGPTIIFGNDTVIGSNPVINDTGNVANFFIAKLSDPVTTSIPTIPNPLNPITIYPNPTTGNVYFSGVQPGYTLQVYDVLGEIIYTGMVDRDSYSINLSGKAKGMYFYRVVNAATFVQDGKIVMQ